MSPTRLFSVHVVALRCTIRGYDWRMAASSDTKHPHVTRTEGVCGGEPVIRGTRFTVRAVVAYVLRYGMTVEEVLREWTHLTAAQVYDALSYYYDHKDEIDDLIRQNEVPFDGRATA